MSRSYKVTGPRPVLGTPPGEVLEADVTPEAEAAMVSAGRVELVPQRYLVVGPREVHGTKPGDMFEAAIPLLREQALIEGQHIEPTKAKPKRSARKGSDNKETKS